MYWILAIIWFYTDLTVLNWTGWGEKGYEYIYSFFMQYLQNKLFFFTVDYTIRTKVDEKINKIKKIFIAFGRLDIHHEL